MTTDISPEFRLLAACCRWPHVAEHRDAIVPLAETADWPLFLKLALFHRVAGLAAGGLKAAGVNPPDAIAAELKAAAAAAIRQSLLVAGETTRLQTAFDAAAIPALFLKGATLAMRAYGSLAAKASSDADLLAAPDGVKQALALLTDAGYGPMAPYRHMTPAQLDFFIRCGREMALRHAKNGLVVELKWRATHNGALLQGLSARSPRQSVTLSGAVAAKTFADAELFAYLCVHGAVHRWARLKWLADLNALLAATPPQTLTQWIAKAEALGAGACAAQALSLCEAVFALPLPRETIGVRHERRARYLTAVALGALAHPAGEDVDADRIPGSGHWTRYSLLLGTRLRYLVAHLASAAIQPHDIAEVALPRALFWLYPVLRLPRFLIRTATRPAKH